MKPVMIIDTGLANVRSVEVALQRLGAEVTRVTSPEDVARSPRLVLPGVGAFGPAMTRLDRDGLTAPLRQRLLAGRPTLAVCLGLQLLCEGSDEAPGRRGLGILPVRVRQLPADQRVPNMGWCPLQNGRIQPVGHAYFAHSFAVTGHDLGRLTASGWQLLTASHGVPYLAAARRQGVLACQFHPELSGSWGEALLASWLKQTPGKEQSWPR
jgi:imidazole glycerol phosphate synthase glutamine amidotransferase subunit